MFLLQEFLKSFVTSQKIRIGFVLDVWPTPYYGRLMASTRLRVYDVIQNFQNHPRYFLELYKPWKHYDIVIFQKKFDASAFKLAQKLKKQGVKIVLDINVNYYDTTISGVLHKNETLNHPLIVTFTGITDSVITSTEYIANYAKKLFPGKKIVCIPENITENFFSVRKNPRDQQGPLKLMYVGYAIKAPEILDIATALQKLRAKYVFMLLVICEKDPKISLPGIEILYRRYRQKHIHQQMLEGDICVAPRDLNQSYNLGHSFTKIGYPMSIGIPVIASKIPSYADSPAILCENETDWYTHLESLLTDRKKRASIGEDGIAYCRKYFSQSVITKKYMRLFRALSTS